MEDSQQTPSEGGATISVHLVVDTGILRAGLTQLLKDSGIRIAGVSEGVARVLEDVAESEADVLLMDLRRPESDGFEIALRLRREHRGTPLLLVLENPSPDQVRVAQEGGIEGIIAPTEHPSELTRAVHALASGRAYVAPSLGVVRLARPAEIEGAMGGAPRRLSGLEVTILKGLALGRALGEIADSCGVPEPNVAAVVKCLATELDCHSAADFARFAINAGYLPSDG